MREYDEAISHYQKATRRDKRNFQANYRLGLSYIRNNQREEGIKCLQMCHSIDPIDIECMIKLSEIYQRDDKYINDAHKLITQVISQDP